MNIDSIIRRIVDSINKKNVIGIALPANPTADGISAVIGLYLGLTKLGKNISAGCASAPLQTVDIAGVDKITQSLVSGGDNLVISFPYEQGSVDKVTYTIEDNRFNLLIMPRDGYEKLNPDQVQYSYTGGKVDAIIVVDAPNLNSLGTLYTDNKKLFEGQEIINIDRHLTNGNFGTINLVLKNVSSSCEIVLNILSNLNVQLDREIATVLYNGISAATNNFTSYSVTAQTMETAAYLLKSGAVKKTAPRNQMQPGQSAGRQQIGSGFYPGSADPMRMQMPGGSASVRQPFGSGGYQPQAQQYQPDYEDSFDMPSFSQTGQQIPQRSVSPFPQQMPSQFSQSDLPENTALSQDYTIESQSTDQNMAAVENKQIQTVEGRKPEKKSAPKEWLKPKIFKGSNLV